jgi:Interferon-induced transmembrane protein
MQAVVPGVAVPNYLVFAILVTVFCCLPTGIAAIIYAAQVNTKLQAGDIAGAQLSSKNAKLWVLISAGAGVLFTLCYGLFMIFMAMNHR